MLKIFRLTLLLICIGVSNTNARADVFRLFNLNPWPVQDYDSKIAQLKNNPKDQILEFTDIDGHVSRFKLISFLGEGQTTAVFRARPMNGEAPTAEIALRIPIATRIKDDNGFANRFINDTLDVYPALKSAGIPVPEIYSFARGQFIAAELITYDFNGKRFFSHPETIDPHVLAEADRALEELAVKTAVFEGVGDFSPAQIVYNIKLKKWTVLDSGKLLHQKAGLTSRVTTFEDFIFERGITDGRDPGVHEEAQLTPREKELIARLSKIVRDTRTLRFRIRCFTDRFRSKE